MLLSATHTAVIVILFAKAACYCYCYLQTQLVIVIAICKHSLLLLLLFFWQTKRVMGLVIHKRSSGLKLLHLFNWLCEKSKTKLKGFVIDLT